MVFFKRFFAAAICLLPAVLQATTISLDTSTTLLDGSTFTAGVTYYAAFQLTGSGSATSQASLSQFNLDTGTGLAQSVADPVSGNYLIGPDASLPAGIWQPGGTLLLNVDPVNAYSLYTQTFTAGGQFDLTFLLDTNLQPPATPDQFAFQLYDSSLSQMLYEVAVDAIPPVVTPEPSTGLPVVSAVVLLLARLSRKLGPSRRDGAPHRRHS